MKKLILTIAAAMVVVSLQAQGYFNLVTRVDSSTAIKFTDAAGTPLSGADFHVQVFAGDSVANLQPLTPLLELNRTGAGAGLTAPFQQVYTTTMPSGTAFVGYQAFQGASLATATLKSDLITKANGGSGADLTVALAVAPNLPNDLILGNGTVALVPEPTTLALGLLGLGSLLMIRRRK